MRKLCRNCESFVVSDGKATCKYLNIDRTDADNPPPESVCWKKRPKLSGAELSLVRARCGRMGVRPAGYGKGRAPCKAVTIHLADYSALSAYARMKGRTLVDTVHALCKSLIAKYPQLQPEGWVE